MPFQSKSQQRWMFANHPDMAKKWADETPNIKALPEKKKKRKAAGGFIDAIMQAGGVYTSQPQIDAANQQAKMIAARINQGHPEDAYVARNIGDPLVKFETPQGMPAVTRPKATFVPKDVPLEDIINDGRGSYYYKHPQTGDLVPVDGSVVSGQRFAHATNALAIKQKGGSIVDYMTAHHQDGSYAHRKQMFDKMFHGNYSGTAEQNMQALASLQNTTTQPNSGGNMLFRKPVQQAPLPFSGNMLNRPATVQQQQVPFGAPVAAPQQAAPAKGSSKLESGVVVDKRTGNAFIIKNGKVQRKFPVLTGLDVDGNKTYGSLDDEKYVTGRATPVGGYMMHKTARGAEEYDNNILDMYPIAMQGEPVPSVDNGLLAIHQTWDPANRDKLYGTKNPYASYGCINCHKPDIQDVMKQFPQGDTLQVIDTKLPQYKNTMKQYQAGGSFLTPMADQGSLWNTDFHPPQGPQAPAINTMQVGDRAQSPIVIPNEAEEEKKNNPFHPQFLLRNATAGLSWLAGMKERGRQNQYMYSQKSTMGQMDAMPVEDFQPNPFSLYAKFGGSMKQYQIGGLTRGMVPQPRYNFSVLNSAPNQTDSIEYKNHYDGIVNKDPLTLKDKAQMDKYGIVIPEDWTQDEQRQLFHFQHNKLAAYQDALNPNMLTPEQIRNELSKRYLTPNDILRPKRKK